jgi:hypothetical protein
MKLIKEDQMGYFDEKTQGRKYPACVTLTYSMTAMESFFLMREKVLEVGVVLSTRKSLPGTVISPAPIKKSWGFGV